MCAAKAQIALALLFQKSNNCTLQDFDILSRLLGVCPDTWCVELGYFVETRVDGGVFSAGVVDMLLLQEMDVCEGD